MEAISNVVARSGKITNMLIVFDLSEFITKRIPKFAWHS